MMLVQFPEPSELMPHPKGCMQCRSSPQIYQPQFVGGGSHIATGGQGSRALWLYDCASGRAVSHGDLGFDPAATLAGAGPGSPFLASAARSVYVLMPELKDGRLCQ